jgi:hypothetical protein
VLFWDHEHVPKLARPLTLKRHLLKAISRNLLGSMALEASHRIRRRASRSGATSHCGYAFDSSEAILFQHFTQSHPFQLPF